MRRSSSETKQIDYYLKSFLFLLYHYPPLEGSAPSRNKRISEAIASKADRSIVLTAAPGNKNTGGLNTIHIPSYDYRYWLSLRKKGKTPSEKTKSSGLAQFVIKLINTYPLNIFIGEGGWNYVKRLTKEGQQQINSGVVTHVYSSFRPFADHYAAYILKRKNPNLIWIADFRDLIIDPHYKHALFPKSQQEAYKMILATADVLTTVSHGLAQHLRAYNPNVQVLRNGVNSNVAKPAPTTQSHFSIVYTGSMFLDKRNPRSLFDALTQLIAEKAIDPAHLQIHYAGKDGAVWDRIISASSLKEYFINHGLLPQSTARELQSNACINLALSVASDELQGVLTGKLIELIEAGSPILAISVGQKDEEIDDMLSTLHIGKAFSDSQLDVSHMKSFVLQAYNDWLQSGMNTKPVNWDAVLSQFNMDTITDEFLASLEYQTPVKESVH
jgi:glycosyltransferase involved in cell wall biosynthesis